MLKSPLSFALAGLGAVLLATPTLAAGIGHSVFMRGSIVATDATGPVVCIGRADGAKAGQVFEVYRVVTHPGPANKGVASMYHRQLVGHVKIDHIFDDHFAHVKVADGTPALNDIVEIKNR